MGPGSLPVSPSISWLLRCNVHLVQSKFNNQPHTGTSKTPIQNRPCLLNWLSQVFCYHDSKLKQTLISFSAPCKQKSDDQSNTGPLSVPLHVCGRKHQPPLSPGTTGKSGARSLPGTGRNLSGLWVELGRALEAEKRLKCEKGGKSLAEI